MNTRISQTMAPSRTRRAPARGFTLLELVIAIAIVAILASIAIPAYNSYILKSHRTDAKTALLDIASLEERFFSTQNVYSQLPTDLGYSSAAFPITLISGDYQISVNAALTNAAAAPSASVPAGTPATFGFTATAINRQVADTACQTLTISSTGAQTATGTDPNANTDCWN